MKRQELTGNTLGEKHRNYNEILKGLISSHSTIESINPDDDDVNNLLKIDIASNNKNVEYILDVLKSDDMLYVSRALARSEWLYTDQKYAKFINPVYLQTEMYPNMTSKAISKLKKYIRHNIKDESRAELFYTHENNKTDASKWLPYCSVEFIVSNIKESIDSELFSKKPRLFKRLTVKSISVFEAILKHLSNYEKDKYLQIVSFLINTDIDKYMDALENNKISTYTRKIKFSRKATQLMMNHSAKRVIDNIEKYVVVIDIATFVNYLRADEIKTFLLTQIKKDLHSLEYRQLRTLFQYNNLKHFIRKLPKAEQFDFVKTLCIVDECDGARLLTTDSEIAQMKQIILSSCNNNRYIWYQFAPFEDAFKDVTKLIANSDNVDERRDMFSTLIKCADPNNLQHVQMILKYFSSKHKSESFKLQFIVDILKHTKIHTYDETTWNILYESVLGDGSDVSLDAIIVNSIIVYNALNDKITPEAIEKHFLFDTLQSYKIGLSEEQQNKIVNYVYEKLMSKIKNPVSDEKDFTQNIKMLENILKLLKDWNKSLLDYPSIIKNIRELIKLKKENSWKESLSPLYNVNKSWRKLMFEESVSLCPTEEVCLNALKHDPQLLMRHHDEVHAIRTNDTISLRRLLAKLRIYWPHSFAQQWINAFFTSIMETKGQKSASRGICSMLQPKPLNDIIHKYKPEQAKIDWKNIEEYFLNVQRLLAQNMHHSRPHPKPDAILLYAKGDYLQYALPSLLAIFYNLKHPSKCQYIPKLLDAPVALQKHGIRLAFKNLDRDELKKISLNCWLTSQNVTIRTIIFEQTFTLLCNEKDSTNAISLWELLELFMDNLTFKEDKKIYELLSKVDKVPLSVRAKFLVKSYTFIQKLLQHLSENERSHFEWVRDQLAEHSREVMDVISPDFVLNLIQEFTGKDCFYIDNASYLSTGMIMVISAYLLCAKNENDQIQKYKEVFVPIMQRFFKEQKAIPKDNHFQELLKRLSYDLKNYAIEKNMIIPVKMYTFIQTELESNLPVSENYSLLTQWKLTVALAKLAEPYASAGNEWDEKIGSEFGKICLDYLKDDMKKYFPCIYVQFSQVVKRILSRIMPKCTIYNFYESMLSDKDCVQSYLACIEIGIDDCRDKEYANIWKKIFSHSSIEVKMHYYSHGELLDIDSDDSSN